MGEFRVNRLVTYDSQLAGSMVLSDKGYETLAATVNLVTSVHTHAFN
jgi:hypothetical protein